MSTNARTFTIVYSERTDIPNPRKLDGRNLGYVITECLVSRSAGDYEVERDGGSVVAYVYERASRYSDDYPDGDGRSEVILCRREFLDLPGIGTRDQGAQAQRVGIKRHDDLVAAMTKKWSGES